MCLPSMYENLVKFDAIAATSIQATDKQRILRAIEVFYEAGKPISSYYQKNKDNELPQYPLLKL